MKYKPIKLGIAALVLTVFGTGSIWGGEITSDSSQKSYDVHLSLRQATVQTFSEAFSEETGVLFSYESGIAGKNFGNVEIDAENLPLESILDPVFAGRKGFSYKIVNSTVIIFWSDNPQTSVIRGTVTDASGEPMIGAGILIKGTTGGTVTDMDGNYSVEAAASDVLVFSFIGYRDVEIPVGKQNRINVTMTEDQNILDDVVVVGYGTQSRKSLTTAIAKVSGSELFDAPVSHIGEALKGKVTGLRVASNNNIAPGEAPRFLIRGGSSITLSNDPIVIVDGVTRDMNDINPNDIESIEVLKDAASAGIYGARASNGVILVTTKKGNTWQAPEITFDAQVGWSAPARSWDLMNSREFLSFVRPALVLGYNGETILNGANAAGTGNTATDIYSTMYLEQGQTVPAGYSWMYDPLDPTKVIAFTDTDWQSEWFQPALWHKEYVGVNGGTRNISYAASISYLQDAGMVAMTGYDLFTMHGNTTFKITKRLTASTTFDFSTSRKDAPTDNYFNAIGRGLMMAPTTKQFYEDGRWVTGGSNKNQQSASFYDAFYDRERQTNRIGANFNLKWDIFDGLSATAQYAIFDDSYRGSYYAYGEIDNTPNYISSDRSTTETRTETMRHTFTAYLNYKKEFNGGHKLDVTAGYDYMKWRYWYLNANSTGSTSDKIPILDSGTSFTASNQDTQEALISYFGRVNYNFRDRYIVSATLRADGSSKFAKGNQWGYFPAGSFAWLISEEPFWDVPASTMNNFKFRVSYGQTGNNGIGLYDTYGSFSSSMYAGHTTLLPTDMQNQGMKWETTTQLDLGLDMGFFNDRLRVVFDYYDKVTDNMLFSITLPDTGSLSSVMANVGSARFWGLELEINSVNIHTKDFMWTTDFTYSFNKNKVLSLPDEYMYTDINGNTAWRIGGYTMSESGERFGGTAVGEPLGRIYGYKISHILQNDAEAAAALYDTQSHGYRRNDGLSITGRKDAGDYEWCNRPGSKRTATGEEQIDAEDMYELGNVMPHSVGGLGNTFKWKNLTVSVYLDYALGHSIYNYMKSRFFQNTMGNCNSNLDKMVYDCWTSPSDTDAKYARFFPNDADYGNRNFSRASDFNVERADYLCLRDVSIYYDLPQKWMDKIKVKKITVGVTGNTLAYWTGVSGGISPETGMGTGSGDSMYASVNNGSANGNLAPPARKILFNVKITF